MASRIDDLPLEPPEDAGDADDAPESAPPAVPDAVDGPEDEHASFEELYELHGEFLHRVLWKWNRGSNIAPSSVRDLHQETFLILAQKLREERVILKVRAMLVAIAWRLYRNRRRERRPVLDGGAAAALMPEIQPDPERQVIARNRVDMAKAIFARMTPGAREVMWRVDVHGDTCAEIAEEQGRDPGAVATQLCRARQRFQELAHEMFPGELEGAG